MNHRPALIVLALLVCAYFVNQWAIGGGPVGPDDLFDQLEGMGYDATHARVIESTLNQSVIGVSSRLTFREAGPTARTIKVRATRPFAFTGWQVRELQVEQP